MILNHVPRPLLAAAIVLVAFGGPAPASAQSDAPARARRIAAIASIAADEYELGVDAGRIRSQAELDEARLFLDEAYDLARGLPEPGRGPAAEELRQLVDLVYRLGPAGELRAGVARVRTVLEGAVGVPLDPMPRAAPSLALGAVVYEANCIKCHGALGAGDGPRAAEVDPPPSDLTDRAALSGSSPLDFFRKITFGIAATDMPSFEEGLTLQERWAVALYTSGFRHDVPDPASTAARLGERCDSCLVWVSDFVFTAGLTDDSLSGLLGASVGFPPDDALAFVRTAAAADVLGADRTLAARRVARRVTEGVDAAVALAMAGDVDAARSRALEAYLEFERVESAVGARSAGAARGVERAFADLRNALAGGNAGNIAAARRQVDQALSRATNVMAASSTPVVLLGQSLLIILREGLEAILIVGALVAFVIKAGARHRVREITLGVLAALAASLATAGAFATVWQLSAARREALEGATMLAASVVLFMVASWMVSKVEAEKWKRFVQAQMRQALSSGGAFALAGVSFLAVYREGFETVLFYGALFGTAEDAVGGAGILAGLAIGLALLAVVYFGIQRYGMRIPMRPFFAVTGILLTVLAVSFAGQGVAEFQAAGWVPATPVGLLPSFPSLGVFPTVQTLVAQFAVTAAFGAALLWIFVLSPRPAVSGLPPRGR